MELVGLDDIECCVRLQCGFGSQYAIGYFGGSVIEGVAGYGLACLARTPVRLEEIST